MIRLIWWIPLGWKMNCTAGPECHLPSTGKTIGHAHPTEIPMRGLMTVLIQAVAAVSIRLLQRNGSIGGSTASINMEQKMQRLISQRINSMMLKRPRRLQEYQRRIY